MSRQRNVERARTIPPRVRHRRAAWKPLYGWTLRPSRQNYLLTGEGEMAWVAKSVISLALLGVLPLILLVVTHYFLPDLPLFPGPL
jgi:hypothetical protein